MSATAAPDKLISRTDGKGGAGLGRHLEGRDDSWLQSVGLHLAQGSEAWLSLREGM